MSAWSSQLVMIINLNGDRIHIEYSGLIHRCSKPLLNFAINELFRSVRIRPNSCELTRTTEMLNTFLEQLDEQNPRPRETSLVLSPTYEICLEMS
jgi:hypothetical protein